MKTPFKFLVQTIFLLGFLIGIVFHPVQAGFQIFKPFAEYINNLRKERKQDE